MSKNGKKSMFKALLSVSGIVIIAKILGFLKQMIAADAFGATIHTDMISISEGLITNVDYLLVQALSTAFIPTFVYAATEDKEKCGDFVSNTIKFFLLISLGISVVIFLAAPLVSKLLAPSYSAELSANLALYIRIFAPSLILIVEFAVFNSLLKANESFVPGEIAGVIQNVIAIAVIFLVGSILGPDALVYSFYLYAIVNLIFLMLWSRKFWSLRSKGLFKDPYVKKLLVMMGPLLIGYSMVFVNQQVDKIIVSGLGEGIVTAMGYAAVLSNFVGTFIGSICGVLFTYITQRIADKNDEGAAVLIRDSAVQMITLFLPISIITVLNSYDIVLAVFGRGKFVGQAVYDCSYALMGYGIMFVPLVLRELFSRVQYAYGDSKQPTINSTISIIINIILSIVLSRFLGVFGVTLATSISVLVCAVLNIIFSFKRNKHLEIKQFIKNVLRWVLGGLVCFGISFLAQRILSEWNAILRFVLVSVVSLLLYCVVNLPVLKAVIVRLKKR